MINLGYYYYVIPVYGAAVALINWIIKHLVKYGTMWMKFRDITSEALFAMTLVCFLQFLNMTIPLMLVNFNFSD